jgi:hypothetical protein
VAGTSISTEFIKHVRELYTMACQEISSGKYSQANSNAHTDYGAPAYILAVAAVEAFVNEMLLRIGPVFLKGTQLEGLSQTEIEQHLRSNLGDKLIEVPELAFGEPVFTRGTQPYQDMAYLIKIRDSFVHYKMGDEAEYENAYQYLVQKKIALSTPERFWAYELSTLEGIRWAHNTVITIIEKIMDTAVKTNRHAVLITMRTQSAYFFQLIPAPHGKNWHEWVNSHTEWIRLKK